MFTNLGLSEYMDNDIHNLWGKCLCYQVVRLFFFSEFIK